MSITRTLVTLTCALLFSHGGISVAANVDKGLEAYHAGDFKTALAQWLLFAEQGSQRSICISCLAVHERLRY